MESGSLSSAAVVVVEAAVVVAGETARRGSASVLGCDRLVAFCLGGESEARVAMEEKTDNGFQQRKVCEEFCDPHFWLLWWWDFEVKVTSGERW